MIILVQTKFHSIIKNVLFYLEIHFMGEENHTDKITNFFSAKWNQTYYIIYISTQLTEMEDL